MGWKETSVHQHEGRDRGPIEVSTVRERIARRIAKFAALLAMQRAASSVKNRSELGTPIAGGIIDVETPSWRRPAKCASETRCVSTTTIGSPPMSDRPQAILPCAPSAMP